MFHSSGTRAPPRAATAGCGRSGRSRRHARASRAHLPSPRTDDHNQLRRIRRDGKRVRLLRCDGLVIAPEGGGLPCLVARDVRTSRPTFARLAVTARPLDPVGDAAPRCAYSRKLNRRSFSFGAGTTAWIVIESATTSPFAGRRPSVGASSPYTVTDWPGRRKTCCSTGTLLGTEHESARRGSVRGFGISMFFGYRQPTDGGFVRAVQVDGRPHLDADFRCRLLDPVDDNANLDRHGLTDSPTQSLVTDLVVVVFVLEAEDRHDCGMKDPLPVFRAA